MRIDKYLFFVRMVKSRSAAQRIAEERHLRIDGRVIDRAAADVKVGSVLTFLLNERVRVLRVEGLPTRRGPVPEALACYTDLSPPAL